MASVYELLLLLAIITNVFLVTRLSIRRDKGFTSASFVVFLTLLLVWAVPQFLINFLKITNSYFTQLDRIGAVGYIFVPVVFTIFAISFAEKEQYLKKLSFLLLMFLPAFVFLFFSWTTELIEFHDASKIMLSPWGISSAPSKFFPVFLIWFVILMILSLGILARVAIESNTIRRRQALWVIFATIIPLSVGCLTDGIMPVLGRDIIPLGLPLTTFTAIVIARAIEKYDLFDVTSSEIISTMGEGIITIDSKGKIMIANATAQRLLGYKRSDLIGRNLFDLIKLLDQAGKEIPSPQRPVNQVISGKSKLVKSENAIITKKRKKFYAGYSVVPVRSGNRLIGATINFRDISRQKEVEENREEFIKVASHELKTPITALKLNAELLERQLAKEKDVKYKDALGSISKQTERLVTLASELLNTSKMETGRFNYSKSAVSTTTLVTDTIRTVRPTLKGRRIIKKVVAKEKVYADRERVSQVMTNLLINAAKYSPQNEKITLGITSDKKFVEVWVADLGRGVPKQMKKKIFDKYFQYSPDRSPGLGVGLYVSKQIVKDHGGKIWVEDNKPRGSRFVFTLPRYKKLHKAVL